MKEIWKIWNTRPLNGCVIVNSKSRDYWEPFEYHKRYLDALASIFSIQTLSPVTAVTESRSQEKDFYLSYNSPALPYAMALKDIISTFLNVYIIKVLTRHVVRK